jgi:hypothetical protein
MKKSTSFLYTLYSLILLAAGCGFNSKTTSNSILRNNYKLIEPVNEDELVIKDTNNKSGCKSDKASMLLISGNLVKKDTVYFMFCCPKHNGKYSLISGVSAGCDFCNYDFRYKMLSYDVVFKGKTDSVTFRIKNQIFFTSDVVKFYKSSRKNYDTIFAQNFKIKIAGKHNTFIRYERIGLLLSAIE